VPDYHLENQEFMKTQQKAKNIFNGVHSKLVKNNKHS